MADCENSLKLFRLLQIQAGVSRRKAHELIAAGEVTINRESVNDPYFVVDLSGKESTVTIRLRGHPIALASPEHQAYRFHKPAGMLCSHDDQYNGNTVGRVLRGEGFIGYTWAGRLDQDAEGLLILSNCGDLIHYLSHPRYGVRKQYAVWVSSRVPPDKVREMARGMCAGVHEGGDELRAIGLTQSKRGFFRITLSEGKKHEVKRLFSYFGVTVKRLQRVSMSSVELQDLRAGTFKRLAPDEERNLFRLALDATGKTGP